MTDGVTLKQIRFFFLALQRKPLTDKDNYTADLSLFSEIIKHDLQDIFKETKNMLKFNVILKEVNI